jgi:hypothetical protein
MNSGQRPAHQAVSNSDNNTNETKSYPFSPFGSVGNLVIFLSGIVFLVVGYLLLSKVDAQATNVAAILSPIMILAGFGLVALSLIIER